MLMDINIIYEGFYEKCIYQMSINKENLLMPSLSLLVKSFEEEI